MRAWLALRSCEIVVLGMTAPSNLPTHKQKERLRARNVKSAVSIAAIVVHRTPLITFDVASFAKIRQICTAISGPGPLKVVPRAFNTDQIHAGGRVLDVGTICSRAWRGDPTVLTAAQYAWRLRPHTGGRTTAG